MDYYVWFKWKGSIDPTTAVEFMNGVEDWGMTKVNEYETPMQLSDSSAFTKFPFLYFTYHFLLKR